MSGPIELKHRAKMQAIATALDQQFNPGLKGKDRKVGFVLLVFPYNEISTGCNYISNGADRKDMVVLFKDLAARFSGSPDSVGHA
jgi:hypothetical protein